MKAKLTLFLVIVSLVLAVPGLAAVSTTLSMTAEILDPLEVSTLHQIALVDAVNPGSLVEIAQFAGIDYQIQLDWNRGLENRFSVLLPTELALSLNGRELRTSARFAPVLPGTLQIDSTDIVTYRLELAPELVAALTPGSLVSGSAVVTIYANY